MKKMFVLLVAVLMALFTFGTANAAFLDGNQIFAEILYPNTGTQYLSYGQLTVGPGVEIPIDGFGGFLTVNVSDTNITFNFLQTSGFTLGAFNGFHFADTLNNITDIASVNINPATNMAGFDASRISFDGNNIWANFGGSGFSPTTVVSLDVVPTPIPSAVWLLGSGVIGLIGLKRRGIKRNEIGR